MVQNHRNGIPGIPGLPSTLCGTPSTLCSIPGIPGTCKVGPISVARAVRRAGRGGVPTVANQKARVQGQGCRGPKWTRAQYDIDAHLQGSRRSGSNVAMGQYVAGYSAMG